MNPLKTRVRVPDSCASARLVMPLMLSLLVLAGTVGTSSVARAAELTPQQKLEMKQLYERATRAYDVGKYNEAIEEYQKAYEIGGDPPMLYNIAQAYRLNDQPGEALRFYRRYLQRAPGARNREDVERKIAELEKSVEDKRKAQAAATPPPVTAPAPVPTPPLAAPTPVGPPAPVQPAPTPGEPGGASPGTETRPAPADEGPSTARQVVSWSFVGAGVLCGVGSLVEGLVARGKGKDVTNMSAAGVVYDPEIPHAGQVANHFAIGLGIAAGALGVTGIVLLLTGGGSSSSAETPAAPAPTAPTAMITPWLGGGLVGAGADFRF
jgi:hypothetical protein